MYQPVRHNKNMTLVYGTVCLDLTYLVPSLAPKGGYVEIGSERKSLGGEAANTAAALKKWGGQVVLVGNPIGSDENARILARLLEEHGLGDAIYPQGEFPAPVCHIYVTPDGERTMYGRGFAEMERRSLSPHIPYKPGKWFTADPNHGAIARQAALKAHSTGMHVYALDFVRENEQLPPGCFWQSSTSWVGEAGDAYQNKRWLQGWLKKHQCTAILTDGANGFFLGDQKRGIRHLPPYPVEGVVDATGAGDVFRAGMLYGFEKGWELALCLQFAAAAAALNCQGIGAIGGLAERAKVEALVCQHPEIGEAYKSAV